MRLPVLLAVAALTLAGCNANQMPNASAQAPSIYWSPAGGNPVHYAQTTGFYAGR